MSSIDRIPTSIRIRGAENSFDQALETNPGLVELKKETFESLESRLQSQSKVVQALAFGFVVPILIIKICDCAKRHLAASLPNEQTINNKKKEVCDSLSRNWTLANYLCKKGEEEEKTDEKVLRKVEETKPLKINKSDPTFPQFLATHQFNKIERKIIYPGVTEEDKKRRDTSLLTITEDEKNRAIEIFLNPSAYKGQLKEESANVQLIHRRLTKMLNDSLFKPWESHILSQSKGVQVLAFASGIPILVAKIHDYALRKSVCPYAQLTVSFKKERLFSSIAHSWVTGRRSHVLDSHLFGNRLNRQCLREQKKQTLRAEHRQLRTLITNKKLLLARGKEDKKGELEANIKKLESQEKAFQLFFKEGNDTVKLENENHETQSFYKQLIKKLEDPLKSSASFLLDQKQQLIRKNKDHLNNLIKNESSLLGTTKAEKKRVVQIFLEADHDKIELESETPHVQILYRHLTQMLEDHLKSNVLPEVYEKAILPEFNGHEMAALDFLSSLSESVDKHTKEKLKLFSSIANSWATGRCSYIFNDHQFDAKTNETFLSDQKNQVLQENKKRLQILEKHDKRLLGITEEEKARAIAIFLEDGTHAMRLGNENHKVQLFYGQLTQMLEDHLKLKVFPEFYETIILPAFDGDHIAALEFLHLATEGAMDHHLDEINGKFTNDSGEYRFTKSNDSSTQIELHLYPNKASKIKLKQKINLTKLRSVETVDVMDYELDIDVARKRVQGTLTGTQREPTHVSLSLLDCFNLENYQLPIMLD